MACSALLAYREINNLHVFNAPEYSNSPRLQNFVKRNFVLSEPTFWANRRALLCATATSSAARMILFCVGVTEDPPQRVQVHNQGKGSSWTAARRAVLLVWTEEHPTLSAARKRENQLKRWSHEKKERLVGGSPRLRSGQGA